MGKVYSKLVESFGYIAEADAAELIRQQPAMSYAANKIQGNAPTSQYGGGYDPDKVQYAYSDGKATDADTATDKPADPEKKKPAKSKVFDPNIQAIQNLYNKLGITDNAGNKLNPDGVWGWRTEEAKWSFYKKFKDGSPEYKQAQDYATKIRKDLQWRLIADRDGRTARGGPDSTQKKDPAIGEPTPAALKAMGIAVTSGQGTQDASTNQLPPELSSVPNPTVGDEYWVKGSRYEFSPAVRTRGGSSPGGWKVTHKAGEFALNGETRLASSLGYTGPGDGPSLRRGIAALDKAKNQAANAQGTQVPGAPPGVINKESTELDIIRKLSGM
jgi:hypothetical protein